MKRQGVKKGFTIIELLTSITIIAILVGILIPALNLARNTARQAKQKAQFASISQAIMTFKNDMGYYPPSGWDATTTPPEDYCGAQKLAEALLGWDLLGFHPDSDFRADGGVYDGQDLTNLDERVGPYLDSGRANAFTLWQLYGEDTAPLEGGTFVICDSFGRKKITVNPLGGRMPVVKAGTPVLYYKANVASKQFDAMSPVDSIYNRLDNMPIIQIKSASDNPQNPDPLGDPGMMQLFYSDDYKILDPKITVRPWPHNPDSYILISAGVDGLYGTQDDVTNF